MTNRPLIVCPLEYERRALMRHKSLRTYEIIRSGTGPESIRRWAESMSDNTRPIVLAGLSAGLVDDRDVGSAYIVSEIVCNGLRHSWRPTIIDSAISCRATSVDYLLATPEQKSKLHAETNAHIADQESVAFAEFATERGWKWAVIRGVSDDCRARLPLQLADWLTVEGTVNSRAVISSLIRRPLLIHDMMRLRSHGRAAMDAVALILEAVLADFARSER